MAQTLKGPAIEGSGFGLVRVVGSFTTNASGTPISVRPSKSNCTVTRAAQGVYVVTYTQPCLSIVNADAWLGFSAAYIGTSGTVAVPTAELGVVNVGADFMNSNSTPDFTTPTSNNSFLIAVYNAGSNHTSLSLTDIYSLTAGNTSGAANTRCMFEFVVSTSTANQ